MLKIVSLPHAPFTWITVTSLDGKSSCCQLSDVSDALIRVTDLDLMGCELCVDGYIGTQSFVVIVLLRKFNAGSCSATMLILESMRYLLLIRSCWDVGDLLTFCCQIFMFAEFEPSSILGCGVGRHLLRAALPHNFHYSQAC